MSERDIFIGRKEEIQMINEIVLDPKGANHILPVIGEGGVGKTWLLREIYRQYHRDSRVIVLQIDYGEVRVQSLAGLTLYAINALGDYIPELQRLEFRKRLSDLQRFAELKFDLDRIRKEKGKVSRYFVELVQELGKSKRILWLFDTVENVKSIDYSIDSLGMNFKNTVMIQAGRPTENTLYLYEQFPAIYRGWIVHDIYELQPFDSSETKRYFDETLVVGMEPVLREKIFLLTGGNPVLVSVAGEWLKRNIALPEDVDLPLEELQALDEVDLAKRRQRFEFALIDRVRTLRQPIDWATLYLAYLNRRYDPKILQLALEIENEAELNEVIKELKTLIFVRKSISVEGGLLHDEAQRLIREYAWPMVDPQGELRQSLARKVISEYYLPEIERLRKIVQAKVTQEADYELTTYEHHLTPIPDEDWLKLELQIECLDYSFRVSDEEGLGYSEQLFDEALDARYSLIQKEAVAQAVHHHLVSGQVDIAESQERVARLCRQMGKFYYQAGSYEKSEQAHKHELELLLQQSADSLTQASVHWALSRIYYRWGKYELAMDELERGLKLAGRDNSVERAQLLSVRCSELLRAGKLEEAEHDGLEALRIARDLEADEEEAVACNNLGAVYGEREDYKQALKYHQISLTIRQKLGHAYDIAQSLTNVGVALSLLGNKEEDKTKLDEAEEYLRRALEIRERIDDRIGVGIVCHNLAWLDLDRGQIEAAEAKFMRALDLCKRENYHRGVAVAHNDLGSEVYTRQKRWAEAQIHLEQSAQIYESIGANTYLWGNYKALAEVNLELGNLQEAMAFAQTSLECALNPSQEQKAKKLLQDIRAKQYPARE